MAEPIPHPKRPLVRPHDTHHFLLVVDGFVLIVFNTGARIITHAPSFFASDGRAVNTERRGHRCTPFCMPFVAMGVLYVMGPSVCRANSSKTLG